MQSSGQGMEVIRSFATWAEAKTEATRLAAEQPGVPEVPEEEKMRRFGG